MKSAFLENKHAQKLGFIVVLLLPVFVYFLYFFNFAVNVPQLDDFHAIFKSLERIYESKTPQEAAQWTMDFHNEHRITYTRLVSLTVVQLNGGFIDLRTLMFIGNLSLVGVLLLLLLVFRATQLSFLYFLPVPFLLFQVQFFENTFFAMAALQNLTVWFFALICLYCTIFNEKKTDLSRFFGVLAACFAANTSGNGLFLFLIIPFILTLQKATWLGWLFWLIGFGLMLLEYKNRLTFSSCLSGKTSEKAVAFLGFIGSFVGANSGMIVPAFCGLVLLVSMFFYVGHSLLENSQTPEKMALRQKMTHNLTKPLLFYICFFGFILLTTFAIVAHREAHLTISTSRYKIVSAMALICVYLSHIQAINERLKPLMFNAALLFSICFCGFTYYRYTPAIYQRQHELLKDAHDFARTGKVANPVYLQIKYRPENDWKKAIKRGFYRFPLVRDSTST